MPSTPLDGSGPASAAVSATLSPVAGTQADLSQGQPRWARVASNAGWVPPETLYLVEHAAALEAVQALLETLASALPFDDWLTVAHVANAVCDDVAADCPCHPRLDHSVVQDGLW